MTRHEKLAAELYELDGFEFQFWHNFRSCDHFWLIHCISWGNLSSKKWFHVSLTIISIHRCHTLSNMGGEWRLLMAKGKLISCLCKTSKMDCEQTERFRNLVTLDGHKCLVKNRQESWKRKEDGHGFRWIWCCQCMVDNGPGDWYVWIMIEYGINYLHVA